MQVEDAAFSTSVFSVDIPRLAPHPNPVTCVVIGRRGPLAVVGQGQSVVGDVILIRPGIEHHILCEEGGLSAMYLDGTAWTGTGALAERLEGRLGDLALAGMRSDLDAQQELRARLRHGQDLAHPHVHAVLAQLAADPMLRMSQSELARRLGLERTQALRLFKASTGTTFRQFKRWTGLQHAARRIVAGDLVRTAALDAGFADTAHLTRTFKQSFGLTPSQAIAGLSAIERG